MRTILLTLLIAAAATTAVAQIAPPAHQPGTQVPPPPIPAPPPVVPPPYVPSVVTPLPQPTYGVPRGVTGRTTYGTSVVPGTYRVKPKPRHKKKRRPRTSEIVFIRTV